MRFENTEVWGFEHAIRGMRNPLESWSKSDSEFSAIVNGMCKLGDNDLKLMKRLITSGAEHRKFMRQIFVSVDITAPLYWWKEADQYRIGVTTNSTSTMHQLSSRPITIDCFEIDDYNPDLEFEHDIDDTGDTEFEYGLTIEDAVGICETEYYDLETIIGFLESLRQKYLKTKDKRYWKELVRWLPESWLQTRTVTMNYENIYTMVHQRYTHKLNEWSGKDDSSKPNFIAWARRLPYAKELIFWDLEEN